MEECFEEIGTIKDIVNNMLLISLSASTRCHACSICATGQEKEMRLTIFNPGDFTIGERVRVKVEGRNLLLASFIVYLVPILDLFIGYFLGYYLARTLWAPEKAGLGGALGGGLFFTLSFFFSRLLNDKMEKSGKHLITVEKISEGQP